MPVRRPIGMLAWQVIGRVNDPPLQYPLKPSCNIFLFPQKFIFSLYCAEKMLYNWVNYGLEGVTDLNCLKCGAELKESGVFCDSCLADMANYPVKPTITVQIPRRPVTVPTKKKAKRQRFAKPEDQIRHLKRVRNWLVGLLIAALLAFAASSTLVVYLLTHQDGPGIGQNYETIDSTGQN